MHLQLSPDFHISYDSAGQGTPLVFLHAFPYSQAMWQPQIQEFSRDHHVLAPGIRGFGGTTGWLDEPSLSVAADDLLTFLDALGIQEPIILCGLSMGGYIGQIFAHRYAQRLKALVLCDTRAEADTEEARRNRDALIEFASSHSSEEIAEKIVPGQVGKTTTEAHPEIVGNLKHIVRTAPPEAVIAAVKALRDRHDMTPWLPAIAVPALLVFGTEDNLATPEVIATLRNNIAGSALETIPGAGHIANFEAPAAFNSILRRFLQSI